MHRYPVCTPQQLYECLIRETYRKAADYTAEYHGSIFNYCAEKCKHPCHYWEYYPTVTLTKFPSTSILSKWLNRSNLHNYILLEVFYERLEYTTVKHLYSMSPQQFISNLGGQLGLWVGGSILTLTQIIMFLLERLSEKKENICTRKSKTRVENGVALTYIEAPLRNAMLWTRRNCKSEIDLNALVPETDV